MKKFNEWWKIWGQLIGFLFLVIYLNGFWIIFIEEFQNNWMYPAAWLVQFFGLSGWYAWQSKKHRWRMPDDIKKTHSW